MGEDRQRGFVYVARGQQWIEEARQSCRSLRVWHPDTPVAIFTDDVDAVAGAGFDLVFELDARPWVRTEPKVWALQRSPFERTAYIDTDTYVCGDLSDLFAVLDRFDLAAVPVPRRVFPRALHDPQDGIPDAFQAPNGGVLAFRRNEATKAFLCDWWERYQRDKRAVEAAHAAGNDVRLRDQPSLRAAMWASQCQVLLLPPEYNMRTLYLGARPLTAVGRVRIIHGRVRDVEALERQWNAEERERLLTPLGPFVARAMTRRVLSQARGVPLQWAKRARRRLHRRP